MNKPLPKIRRVAVLGSGTVKDKAPVYQQATKLGAALAREGFTVYHGGYGGVMEAVARGCRSAGGRNVGVTIRKKGAGSRNPWVDAEVEMPFWRERLFKLIEAGEAYIFLDGATGTLNELFFVWEMANKKLHAKPIILLGKQLHAFVKFLKKGSSLKIPSQFYLTHSVSEVIRLLKQNP